MINSIGFSQSFGNNSITKHKFSPRNLMGTALIGVGAAVAPMSLTACGQAESPVAPPTVDTSYADSLKDTGKIDTAKKIASAKNKITDKINLKHPSAGRIASSAKENLATIMIDNKNTIIRLLKK